MAKNPTRALARIAAAAFALTLGASLPAQGVIPYLERGIEVDGDPHEWSAQAWTAELDRAEQVYDHPRGQEWGGIDDLSATVHVAYDSAHLYFGADVRDNDLVRRRDGGRWNEADAIEVLLDLEPGDRDETRFDADDLQLFLMPFNPVRSWGLMTWMPGRPPQPGGAALTGVRVAHRERADGTGYTVEAVVPLHNLTVLARGAESIGFCVALDDWDGGTDRYQYMTLDGVNPVSPIDDTSKLRQLRFAPPGPGVERAAGGGAFYEDLLIAGQYVLIPLLIVAAVVLLMQLWGACARRLPALQLVGPVCGVLMLAAGLVLPPAWISLRKSRFERRAESIAAELQQQIPAMENGTLGSYRGGERDQPLMDLLAGKAVARKHTVVYDWLVDLAEAGFGPGAQRYPGVEGFALRPYWIPLRPNEPEHFKFRRSLAGGALNVVLAAGIAHDPETPLTLRIGRHARGEAIEPQTEEIELRDVPWTSVSGVERPGTEMTYVQLALDDGVPLDAISVTATSGAGMSLVGVTHLPELDADGEPQFLGGASLVGVETELRGAYPAHAGIELHRDDVRVVAIPEEDRRGWDKIWLFYKADHPGTDQPVPSRGARVAEVIVRFEGGKTPPQRVELLHQESVFFELERYNQHEKPPDPRAKLAFQWEDEDYEKRLNLVYEVELGRDAPRIASIEFRNFADYALHFRSVVFGAERPTVVSEPADSPLVYTEDERKVRLGEELLERVADFSFAVFRNGSRTTEPVDAATARRTTLPRGVRRPLQPGAVLGRNDGDTRGYETYVPLSDEATLLGVFVDDPEHGEVARWLHRIGVALCLLAAPLLLLLFSEILKALNNLRLRLMAVLTVATLVPLIVLSLVLVRVLEGGHEQTRDTGMRQAMATALERLDEERERVAGSAQTWLETLVAAVEAGAAASTGADQVRADLEDTLRSQKPPDWERGFLRCELAGTGGLGGGEPLVAAVGDVPTDMPLRPEPGLYVWWGHAFIGVRIERETSAGRCTLSVGRSVDRGLLGGLSPGRGVVLCGMKGYPLASASGGGVPDDLLSSDAARASLIAARGRAAETALENGHAVLSRHAVGRDSWSAVYDVLRDLQDTPRALLGVVERDQAAVLPLALGAVPVRGFFLAVGGLMLLLSLVLSYVVTTRITEPIERLERGAQAIGSGELDVEVPVDAGGGQIGRLTRTFNQMARDLRNRVQDLHLLNRGMQDLTAKLDLRDTVRSAVQFCAHHTSADRVRLLLHDPERDHVVVYGDGPDEVERRDDDVRVLLEASGELCMRLAEPPAGQARGEGRRLAAVFEEFGSLVAFPLALAGRSRGAILLLFRDDVPSQLNLELLATMAAQTAVAIENARLYLHAVEDLYTGAYLPYYFRRLVVQEVTGSRRGDTPIALLAVRVAEARKLAESMGGERYERLMARIANVLRRVLPSDAPLCRADSDQFQALLPATGRGDADAARERVRTRLDAIDWGLPSGFARLALDLGSASYPEESASAEFLFHALDAKLATQLPPTQLRHRRLNDLEADGIALTSPAMRHVVRTIERVAPTDLTVLLLGETGTGKEVVADLVHRWSRRAAGPMVKVHCAAIPETLLASELFGHERGAFTGATERKIGKFEQAHGGTIFLDEIGEISLEVQVQLLRVLQEREIDRIGGGARPIPVDVRILAATNRDIRGLVAEGRFREDLYYRLQGMLIDIPPLRERKQEIPALVEAFRREAVAAEHTAVQGFEPDMLDELYRRDWPGNIRELRNTVFRAMVLARGPLVQMADLGELAAAAPAELPAAGAGSDAGIASAGADGGGAAPASPDAVDGDEKVVAIQPAPRRNGGGADERLARLRELIRSRGSISNLDYVAVAGVSPRTGLRDLNELLRRGEVVREGKRRGARYRLAVSDRDMANNAGD